VPEYARSLRHQREEYNDIHIADLFLCCCCDDEGRPGKSGDPSHLNAHVISHLIPPLNSPAWQPFTSQFAGKGGYRPVGTKDLDMADENIEMAPIAKPKAAEVA
jgi:hypothetical protein